MSLADPELELIDPTPNIHALFVQFDVTFFWSKLASRAVVRWSKRMYSCAGVCSYEGRGGLCDVALSEPLLKLRPRKDLIETLLHEMIHAYLFIVGGDRDRDGHGPIFQSHMHRINRAAGLNISIYHDFHDEVKLYQTHWWRCNGPCQHWKPYFGIVRRTTNRAPNPREFWWDDHWRRCGGTFIKIKEPEQKGKGKTKPVKSMGDITKFMNTTTNANKTETGISLNKNDSFQKPVGSMTVSVNGNIRTIKDLYAKPQGGHLKTNGAATVVVTQNNNNLTSNVSDTNKNITNPIRNNTNIIKNNTNIIKNNTNIIKNNTNIINNSIHNDVTRVVRNVWANKQFDNNYNNIQQTSTNKRNSSDLPDSPVPTKIKKFDTDAKPVSNEVAATVLKDIYGENFTLYHNTKKSDKIIAVTNTDNSELVTCPLCNAKVKSLDINNHIDECLNKPELDKIFNETKDLSVEEIPSTSEVVVVDLTEMNKKCPCCNDAISVPMEEHLEDCLSFFNNKNTVPDEAPSNPVKVEQNSSVESFFDDNDSFADELDESGIFNDTGTKYPCPCCLDMIEETRMNPHLDVCLHK